MSNYGLMYNTNDFHQSNGASQTRTNYFENQIKEGLSFFNQNKLQSTLRNNYFNESDSNINLRARNGNAKIITSTEKNDMSEIEAKKILEREMNPYLSYMKKELKSIVDQYSKDINEKNSLIKEIASLKNEIEILKRTNDNLGNDILAKILKNNENINLHERKISNMELDINKFNQLFSIESNQNNQIPSILVDLSNVNDKIKIMEKNNENILADLGKVVESSTNIKFNECFTNIKNLKEENNELREKIDELNNIIKGMKSEGEKRNQENLNQINNNEDAIRAINQLKLELRNKEDKIENLENEYENINNKIIKQDKIIEELSGNIGTEHSSIITIANNMKNFNKKADYLEKKINDTIYKKDFIDNKLEIINEQINSQNEKIKENNKTINENFNEKNNILYLDLLKKIEDSKNSFENYIDQVEATIRSISINVNDVTTIIRTHPMLNMNSHEIINMNFKETQNKYNEIFKQNLIEINKEIQKLKDNSKIIDLNKENLIKVNENFGRINEFLKKINEDTKNTEENLNNFKSEIENKFNSNEKDKEELENIGKNIEELNNKISCLEGQLSINAGIQNQGNNNNIDLGQFNEIKKDIKKLENDLKIIQDEKIPEILNMIDNKIQNQKIAQVPAFNNNNNLDTNNNINKNTNENNNININIKTSNEDEVEEKEDFGNDGLFGFSRRRGARNQQKKKENKTNESKNKFNDRNDEFTEDRKLVESNNNYEMNNNFGVGSNNYGNNYGNNDNYNFENNYNYNNYDENNNYENNANYNYNNDNFNNKDNYNDDNYNNGNNDYNINNFNKNPSGQINDIYGNEYEDGWNNNQNNSRQNNDSKMNNNSYRLSSNNSKEKDSTDNMLNKIINGEMDFNKNEESNSNNNANNENERDDWD